MGVFSCVIGNNDAGALNGRGFEVAEEIVFISFIDRRHPVVADERLSEDKDLALVRGIGHGFRVSNDGSGKYGLTADVTVCPERNTMEHRSILR